MKFTAAIKENYMFRKLYGSKQSYVCPYFVLYCRKNKTGFNRLGITTGTKLGGAVVRNRCRRRLKEMYRLHESRTVRSLDIVLVARSRCLDAPFSDMEREYEKALDALGIGA